MPFMQGRPSEVNCSYLVGCDGARSSVRRAAGIQMEGPTALQHLVNIHFFCPDLWQHISQRPAMLYFVFNSDVVSVLVGHDLPNGELVAQVRALPSSSCRLLLLDGVQRRKIASTSNNHILSCKKNTHKPPPPGGGLR